MSDQTNTGQGTSVSATDATTAETVGTNSGQQTQTQDPEWLGERLKRAQETARKALLQELGIEKPDEIKGILADYKKRVEAETSELDRVKTEANRWQEKATGTEAKAKAAILKSQFSILAQSAGCVDPDTAYQIAQLSNVAVDLDSLSADGEALTAAVEGLKQSKPYLFQTAQPPRSMPTGGPPSPSGSSDPELAKLESAKAELMKQPISTRRQAELSRLNMQIHIHKQKTGK